MQLLHIVMRTITFTYLHKNNNNDNHFGIRSKNMIIKILPIHIRNYIYIGIANDIHYK